MIPAADYHLHTSLCGHAAGDPAQYVAQAQKIGLSEVGFSDHAPLLTRGVDVEGLGGSAPFLEGPADLVHARVRRGAGLGAGEGARGEDRCAYQHQPHGRPEA